MHYHLGCGFLGKSRLYVPAAKSEITRRDGSVLRSVRVALRLEMHPYAVVDRV